MVGLACSKTRLSRESMVLSIVMVPFWQANTTPPRQEGPCWPFGAGGNLVAVSRLSLTVFDAPVSAFTTLAYSAAAVLRQPCTSLSSQALHRTSTVSSRSISKPWTMRLVMNGLAFASFCSSLTRCPFVSSASLPITSWRALIFSRRDLLMAEERAIAFCVSICLAFRSYSCRIFSSICLTSLCFSTLNSCSALVVISSALSFASLRMNSDIW
mmetsp:Transcript_85460/g.238528  ORF Transcript_85460/g.238528 Transcript_85460/m.238528 type:complete len:213 (-) Transcript_85460:135-773(-)